MIACDSVDVSPPEADAWPHAPARWATVLNTPFDTLPGDGWQDRGDLVVVSDSSAPLSPPYVVQYTYPQGQEGGMGVGSMYRAWPAGVSSHFVGYWFKLSERFDNRFGMKQWYPGPRSGYFVVIEGASAPPYDLRIEAPIGVQNWYSNVAFPNITIGTWHQFELLVDYGARRLRWWVDGKLCGDYVINWTVAPVEARLESTWGSVADTIQVTGHMWMDHFFMSWP